MSGKTRAGVPDVTTRLARLIQRRGPITFRRFMREALYGRGGYYDAGLPVGRDFHTAPRISPLFGRLLARGLVQIAEKNTTFVELGAGRGDLAIDLLAALPADFSYVGVEAGGAARARLREAVAAYGCRARVLSKLPRTPFNTLGIVIANELFDALPCHRVVGAGGGLREIYVGWRRGGFVEVRGEPSTGRLERRLAEEGVKLRSGQKAEICLETGRIYRELGRAFRRCVMIVIDYGYEAPDLYSSWRPEGTVRSYRLQRESDDPLGEPGRQDITYHVDLTRLRLDAARHGFATVRQMPQYELLLGLGAPSIIPGLSTEERLSLKTLLMPGGMGDRFTVLVQVKGVELDPDWCPRLARLVELWESDRVTAGGREVEGW